MTRSIVIMAGGTGGHVFPALAVAQDLLQRGWRVSWLGTRKGLESRVVPANAIEIDWLNVEGIRGKGLFSRLLAVFRLVQACKQAIFILRRRRPDVVLGMGGFVAGPGGLMARMLGIPLVIHEQNRVPGTTNRLLLKLTAAKVLEAFPGSFAASAQAVCTGNPIRSEFADLPARTVWQAGCGRALRVLVLGGSQGARVLNENVPAALAQLAAAVPVQVRHQSGVQMCDQVKQSYQTLGVAAEVSAFIDDMATAYAWADLLICRAGAMTVSEVAASGAAAIFVPLQNAIDDHQTANARFLSEAGAALLLPQTRLDPESLGRLCRQAMESLAAISMAAKSMARPEATRAVADICSNEAGG